MSSITGTATNCTVTIPATNLTSVTTSNYGTIYGADSGTVTIYPDHKNFHLETAWPSQQKTIRVIDVTDAVKEKVDALIERQKEIDATKPEPRPIDPIKQVFINSKKGTTTILWNDGEKTVVTCQGEEFDLEKGIAMCFMKKMYDNRGCFNEFLNKWVDGVIDQGVNRPKVKKVIEPEPPKKSKRRRFKKKTK